MLELGISDWLIVGASCVVAAIASVYWLIPVRLRAEEMNPLGVGRNLRDQTLLFDGSDLVDASTTARKVFGTDSAGFDWGALHKALIKKFPDFPNTPAEVQKQGRLSVSSGDNDGAEEVCCEWIDGVTRVQLRHCKQYQSRPASVTMELETLRMAMGQAPYPVWHVDPDSNLNWSNAAYDTLLKKVGKDSPEASGPLFPSSRARKKTRASVAIAGGGRDLWFDVFVFKQEKGFLCYAIDIDAVVDAEIAQRNFVQTLAKTFAQLSIGLAIFDRNRQLALFNPALIDLTALPADFLSSRPNLLSFFDRLRDHRMMPEPKNYGSWRHQMADLVAAAADGRYQETWTLPSGAVHSVCGRPHPDGAVAFLFEDITAEITLTRSFRTDIEINQSVLDQMDDAIAVFSDNGALCTSNLAYRRLWGVDPEASFAQMTVSDATRIWQSCCRPTPILGEIRDFVAMRENRVEWGGEIQLSSGQGLSCYVFPISHGATMVRFNHQKSNRSPAETTQTKPGAALASNG